MSMLLGLLLTGGELPDLDRGFLKARVERVLQEERAAAASKKASVTGARKLLATDLHAVAAVCGAATRAPKPAAFLAKITAVYGMSSDEKRALSAKCALFSMGLAQGRKH
jgi:hypothetical protein